ncbi:MAG: hypothetical protein RR348_03035, partial [Clostridia bacterium]
GINSGNTYTYGYKFGETFDFDKTLMKKYSNTALANITAIGSDKGVLVVTDKTLTIYNKIAMNEGVDNKNKALELSAAPTVLFIRDIDTVPYMYYTIADKMYRIAFMQSKGVEQLISDDGVGVTFAPAIIGDEIYFVGKTYAYMYKMNFMKFVEGANTITKPSAELVSGFEESDKTKDGKAPKFFNAADKKSYIAANAKEEVKA